MGAAEDCIPRFRGESTPYSAFASFEQKVGQLRACRLLLKGVVSLLLRRDPESFSAAERKEEAREASAFRFAILHQSFALIVCAHRLR